MKVDGCADACRLRYEPAVDIKVLVAMKLLSDDTRVKWALAVFLALVAGYLDGYGLLVLGTYVSFMSGNTTLAGLKSGQGNFQAALPSAIAVLSFVTGSFLGNLLESI